MSSSATTAEAPGATVAPFLPALVIHADWGLDPKKRWAACATLGAGGRYEAGAPTKVANVSALLATMRSAVSEGACVVAGFDFPIGVPARYARGAGIGDFVGTLPLFGQGVWQEFYNVAKLPREIGPYRPFYPSRPGGTSHADLVSAHGVEAIAELLRQCERPTGSRGAACPLFWTLGGNQVGKGAISGWRDLLAPALADPKLDVALWPFAGAFSSLLRPGRLVIVETYPADVYARIGVDLRRGASNGRSGKTWQASRAANAPALATWAARAGVAFAPALTAQLQGGFGSSKAGEDPFDAVIGLCGMLDVVLGRTAPGEPNDPVVRRIEGWILGMPSLAVASGATLPRASRGD